MSGDEPRRGPVEEYAVTFTRYYIDGNGKRFQIDPPLRWQAVYVLGIPYNKEQVLSMLLGKCKDDMLAKLREDYRRY